MGGAVRVCLAVAVSVRARGRNQRVVCVRGPRTSLIAFQSIFSGEEAVRAPVTATNGSILLNRLMWEPDKLLDRIRKHQDQHMYTRSLDSIVLGNDINPVSREDVWKPSGSVLDMLDTQPTAQGRESG